MRNEALISRMEGIVGIEPRIKKVSFDARHIILTLEDGRIIYTPLKYFPSLKKVPVEQREKYQIFDDGKALDIFACDEMYHIRDFLGIPEKYLR